MNKLQKQTTIMIADDHPLFLTGLREIISGVPDWQIIAEAINGQQALEFITKKTPDISILDINMPLKDGLEVAKFVHENNIPTSVIILTMYDDEMIFKKAASYCIKGFILKESAIDDVIEGIEHVVQGDTFVSPKLFHRFLKKDFRKTNIEKLYRYNLTNSEQKILKMIANNYTTRQIAEKLFISPKTVEHHRSNICKKFNLTGKNALLRFVLENKEILNHILCDE